MINEPENLKTYAHIIDGKVVDISIWDGQAEFTVEEDLIQIPSNSSAGIGWDYVDGKFVDNRPVSELPII